MEHRVSQSTTNVDLRDLQTFCRVVDLGSMTAAARSLGETKGTVSRRVARLERSIGAVLIRREGRRAAPTDEGLAYRERAGAALDMLEDAEAMLGDLRAEPSGHLRITSVPGIGTTFLGPLLAPFTAAYPRVTLELLLTEEVLSFRDHRIDCALRIGQGLPDSSLVAHSLFELQGALVAAPSWLADHGTPRHPEDLADHRLLLVPLRGLTLPMQFEHRETGERVEVVLRSHIASHDGLLLREAALAGAGIAALIRPMGDADLASGRLVTVLEDWALSMTATLYLLHAGGTLPPKVRAFRDFVKESVSR